MSSVITIAALAFVFLTLAAGAQDRRAMGPVQRQLTGAAYLLLLICAVFAVVGVLDDVRPLSIAIWSALGVYGLSQFGRDLLVPWGRDRDRITKHT